MKIIPFLFISLFSFSCTADSKLEILEFGSTLLHERYNTFAQKMNQCDDLSEISNLSENTISKLKEIPKENAIGLAVLSHKALQTCALYEYSEVLRTLVSLESHKELANNSVLLKEIERIRPLLVADMSLYIEKDFQALPKEVKSKLKHIDELKTPFNLIDAVERAWGLAP